MHIPRIAASALAGLALMAGFAAYGQSTTPQSGRSYGYVDLKTGVFHPGKSEADTNTVTTPVFQHYTGSIEAEFSITIAPNTLAKMPTGSSIVCTLDIEAIVGGVSYTEVDSTIATISGDTATCTVTLPYNWLGETGEATSDYYFYGDYKITAINASATTEALTDYNIVRESEGELVTTTGLFQVPIPANGTVTTYTIDAKI